MKKITYSLAVLGLMGLLGSTPAFAETEPAPAPEGQQQAQPEPQPSPGQAAGRLSPRQARKACKAENPQLRGRALKRCIQEKMGKH